MLSSISLARANLYRSLAAIFFDPTIELISQLLDGTFALQIEDNLRQITTPQAAAQALYPLKAYQAARPESQADTLLKDLKVEYARLFIGPGGMAVPPYETLYAPKSRERRLMLMVSPEARSVENFYREAGITVKHGLREPPDHFATEAEFLYYLCQKEADAWSQRDKVSAQLWRERERSFLDQHLGKWGPWFCRQVERESTHPFYTAAARFGSAWIETEVNSIIQNKEVKTKEKSHS